MLKQWILLFYLLSSISFAREIDLNNLIKKASNQNKTLFLFIHTTDCGYCESMLEFTLDNDKIKSKLNRYFIYEHINVKDDDKVVFQDFKGDGLAFAQTIGYDLYPSSLFFDNNSNLIFGLAGYQDEKRFDTILDFIISKSYLEKTFHKYEKELR